MSLGSKGEEGSAGRGSEGNIIGFPGLGEGESGLLGVSVSTVLGEALGSFESGEFELGS